MKTLIIYVSVHHGNTEKVAKEMAEVLNADLLKPTEVDPNALSEYDLIGFGSGIYLLKHHESLLNFVDKMDELKGKKAFIFSTSGFPMQSLFYSTLRKSLSEKGFDVVNEFSCRGFTTYGPFKRIGGINKDKPNKEDLENARKFAADLKKSGK